MTRTTAVGKSPRSARRRDRFRARYWLHGNSTLPRVKGCGRAPAPSQHDPLTGPSTSRPATQIKREPLVHVRVTGEGEQRRAGFSGLMTCGSTWACPACAEKVQAERQSELVRALEAAARRGWVVGFHTFTVRHSRTMPLKAVWGAVSKAWRSSTSGAGRRWAGSCDDHGVQGYLRLVEVTHGRNGWHVHVHVLFFYDPVAASLTMRPLDLVQSFGSEMAERWRGSLASTPFQPSRRRSADHRLVTTKQQLPDYFTKGLYDVKSREGAAYDVTGSFSKEARNGNRTPFAILSDAVRAGSGEVRSSDSARSLASRRRRGSRDAALWAEWEQVSRGKRQLLWSNGMRALLLPDPERTDEEIAAANDLDGRTVLSLDAAGWRRLVKARALADVLDAAERDDNDHSLYEVLHRLRVPWRPFGSEPPALD
jgi:hypothetical protein